MTIQQLLDKHEIKHGIENDQARIDAFVKELSDELARGPHHFDSVDIEWYVPLRRIARFLGVAFNG
jgi:hypothetical protein